MDSGASCGWTSVGQVDVVQALEHLLAREVVVDVVVEGEDDERQAELRVREHAHRVRQPAQRDLERNRDLLLDFLRRVAGIQRDDGHLDVGDVGKRLDRQRAKRDDAAADEQQREQQHEQRLMQREGDDASEASARPLLFFLPQQQRAVDHDAVAEREGR